MDGKTTPERKPLAWRLDYDLDSAWKDVRTAAVGGLVLATACTPSGVDAINETDSSQPCRNLQYELFTDKVVEVAEQIGTTPESVDENQFDYVESTYTVQDLAEEISDRSRGFTKEEAEGYEEALKTLFG
jgi:hypothetical protein